MVQQHSALETSTSGQTDLRSGDLATIEYEHSPFRKYPQQNKRAAPILDALAAIAVSKPVREVIAVAMSFGTGSDVHLIVSSNSGVEPATIEFLKAVWQQLRYISSVYSKRRTGPPPDERDKSPTIGDPEGDDMSLQDTLYRTIFKFCIKKFEKRFIKYWRIISAFISAYVQWLKEKRKGSDFTDSTADSLRRFVQLDYALTACSKMLPQLKETLYKDDELFRKVFNCMDTANNAIKDILASAGVIDIWISRVRSIAPQDRKLWLPLLEERVLLDVFYLLTILIAPLRLKRAMEKIRSLFRYCRILFTAAHSPRLSTFFERNFFVHAVPASNPRSGPPHTDYEWWRIRAAMCDIAGMESTSLIEEDNPKLPNKMVVHCEVSLICFMDSSNSIPPAFNYIGVSKLSCKACYYWITAWNSCTGRTKWHTAGSHDKWYPWQMPKCSEVVERGFVELVSKEYGKIRESQGSARARADSQSTSASFDSNGPKRPNAAQKARDRGIEANGGKKSEMESEMDGLW
jgi:hypothetical protein